MIELGNFVASAFDSALRSASPSAPKVYSEGCQGVRPNRQPVFEYAPGDDLVVGRGTLQLHDYPSFESLLMVPASVIG